MISLNACKSPKKNDSLSLETENIISYRADSILDKDSLEKLTLTLTTYIYRKPATANWQTKFDTIYRSYYKKHAAEFTILYLHEYENFWYYYLTRPARDTEGKQKRGVGGKFQVNQQNIISHFEEIFNTPIAPENELARIGKLFLNAICNPSPDTTFLVKKEYVEWPDGRLFYSKEKFEWRYTE